MFNDEQRAKLKAVLEAEPCLYNARHKRDYLVMSNWLNEVGGKQLAAPEDVAAIMVPAGPERWDAQLGKWVALEVPAVDAAAEAAAADVWAEKRKELGDILGV